MIMRTEFLLGEVVISSSDHPRLGSWPSLEAASEALRRKAAWLDPESLTCGGYETRKPNPNTGLRERVSFWPDGSPAPQIITRETRHG